jgi:hypothetical protein
MYLSDPQAIESPVYAWMQSMSLFPQVRGYAGQYLHSLQKPFEQQFEPPADHPPAPEFLLRLAFSEL